MKPELATRYEELLNMRNMEIDQFNDGFNDARAGKLETDHPHYDFDTDNWRLGFAWGMFEPMKEKLVRERQVSDALYLLLVDDPNTKLKAEQILIDIYGVDVKRDLCLTPKSKSLERKEFCPNCEAIVPCTYEAELYVCDICGEDFAKYIAPRNCNDSDVSVTQKGV